MAIILKSVMARCSIWGFWPWEMEARDMVTKKVRVLRCQPAWELQNKTCSQKEASHRSPKAPKKNASFLAETQNQHLQHFPLYSWQLRAEMAHYVAHGSCGPVLSEGKLIELKYLLLRSFVLFTIYADLVRFCTRLGLINICFVSDDENIGLFRALPPQPLLLLCSSPEPKCNE